MSTAGRSSSRRWVVGLVAVAALAAGGLTLGCAGRRAVRRPRTRAVRAAPTARRGAARRCRTWTTAVGDGDEDGRRGAGARGRPAGRATCWRAVAANAGRAARRVTSRSATSTTAGASTPRRPVGGRRRRHLALRRLRRGDPVARGGAGRPVRAGRRRPGRRSPAFGGGDRRVAAAGSRGPVEVRRAADTLVRGRTAASASEAERYARPAAAAVPVVRRVLPRLARPAGGRGAGSERGARRGRWTPSPGSYAGIAAVTASGRRLDRRRLAGARVRQPGRLRRPRADRGAGGDQPRGDPRRHRRRQRATSPLWLLEGFADYVALRDVDLPLTHHGRPDHPAGPPRRRAGPPARTRPSSTTGATHLGATYESAWLACVLLAERGRRAAPWSTSTTTSRDGRDLGRPRCGSASASPRPS